MAKYVIEDTTLNNTANAIREKTGKTDKITPSNFATEIASIETGGSSTVTKGIIVNECDSDGYATDVSVVGMTKLPYLYLGCFNSESYASFIQKNIENVNLCDGITEIGESCFAYDKKLKTIILPDTVTKIGRYCFRYCEELMLNKLPSMISSLEERCFNGCLKITINEIPENITTLKASIFEHCNAISEITCKGIITSINSKAFKDCTKLEKFVLTNVTNVPSLDDVNVFLYTPIESGTGYIYVPDALVDSFKSATNWSTYADQIKPISEMEASS